jgi:hypothetical protein
MLAAKEKNRSQTTRTKATVVFAVLLLAALQLTTATHRFDHAAGDLGEVCAFCLALDRLDDAVVADDPGLVVPSLDSDYIEDTLPSPDVIREVFSQARAPPLS